MYADYFKHSLTQNFSKFYITVVNLFWHDRIENNKYYNWKGISKLACPIIDLKTMYLSK